MGVQNGLVSPEALLRLLSQPITVSNTISQSNHNHLGHNVNPVISLAALQNLSNLIQTMGSNYTTRPQPTQSDPPTQIITPTAPVENDYAFDDDDMGIKIEEIEVEVENVEHISPPTQVSPVVVNQAKNEAEIINGLAVKKEPEGTEMVLWDQKRCRRKQGTFYRNDF